MKTLLLIFLLVGCAHHQKQTFNLKAKLDNIEGRLQALEVEDELRKTTPKDCLPEELIGQDCPCPQAE
jgi:hypothetical protein